MNRVVDLPPLPIGTDPRVLYSYLYRMAEQLNVALDAVNTGGVGSVSRVGAAGVRNSAQQDSVEELKALIMNTANTLHSEMDRLEQVLHSEQTAISDRWGVYREQINSTITATAEGIVQQYGFEAIIEGLAAQVSGFEQYRIFTEGFIRQGFIERDENGVPIIGIAIGKGLTGVETVVDGQKVLELDETQSCVFYTAERVSFRIGGREVAYLSNRKLYVEDVEITGGLWLGRWLLEGSDGFTVRFIG